MRKLLFIAIPVLLLLIGSGLFIRQKLLPPKPVHYHAGFIVVKNNQIENFTDVKYMSIRPCTTKPSDDSNETSKSIQIEKAHLHDNIGDVVHVERVGAKWKDLFTNLSYPINYSDVTAVLNGQHVLNVQDKPIAPYDSLVLFIGANNDTSKFLSLEVTKQHIQDVEAKSEDCGNH